MSERVSEWMGREKDYRILLGKTLKDDREYLKDLGGKYSRIVH